MKAPPRRREQAEYIHMPLKKYKYKNTNPCDAKSVDSSQPQYHPEEVGKSEKKKRRKNANHEKERVKRWKRAQAACTKETKPVGERK